MQRHSIREVPKGMDTHDAVKSCFGKFRYASKNRARDALIEVNKKGNRQLQDWYKCPCCKGFHLTHWDKENSSAIRRLIKDRSNGS